MAIVRPITDRAGYEEWLAERPLHIRAVIERLPGDRLYRLKSTGDRCTIYSYGEKADGAVSLTVDVTGEFNRVLFGRRVFGIDPGDLEECDPPGPEEDVGDTSAEAGYTEDDVREILIPKIREDMRARGQLPPEEKS